MTSGQGRNWPIGLVSMAQTLARYHARSPRYILNTEDDFFVRVAGPRQTPWEEGTEIRNVSLTGLAFTAPDDLCPLLGEVVKIQFMIPGGQQMACHAIVTRLEEDREGVMLVGVHFYKLEMAHRIVLAQGLSKRFREQLHLKKGKSLKEGISWSLGLGLAGSLGLWLTLMGVLISVGSGPIFKEISTLMQSVISFLIGA